MAITYFAMTSTDNDSCSLSGGVMAKVMGFVRCWYDSPHTPSNKWIIVGRDMVAGDYVGFRSISTQQKNAIIKEVNDGFGRSHMNIQDYVTNTNALFHIDISLSASIVDAL